jgi:hypothetical protein
MGLIIVFGVVFFGIGLGLLLLAVNQGKKAKEAEAWPTVPGVILSSGLEENRKYDREERRTEITYEPQVQYQYSLLGQNYQGSSLSFGKAAYDFRNASKKIAPYPQGAQVVVHYDPVDPNKAVLETKSAGGIILYVIGIIFMLIGLAIPIGTIVSK